MVMQFLVAPKKHWEEKGMKNQVYWRLPEGDDTNRKVRRTILKNTLKDHEKMVYKEIKIQMAD